jgi:hypothetical protein
MEKIYTFQLERDKSLIRYVCSVYVAKQTATLNILYLVQWRFVVQNFSDKIAEILKKIQYPACPE